MILLLHWSHVQHKVHTESSGKRGTCLLTPTTQLPQPAEKYTNRSSMLHAKIFGLYPTEPLIIHSQGAIQFYLSIVLSFWCDDHIFLTIIRSKSLSLTYFLAKLSHATARWPHRVLSVFKATGLNVQSTIALVVLQRSTNNKFSLCMKLGIRCSEERNYQQSVPQNNKVECSTSLSPTALRNMGLLFSPFYASNGVNGTLLELPSAQVWTYQWSFDMLSFSVKEQLQKP